MDICLFCLVLREVIEKYTENARFCLICNYLSKIIPALQSRCTRFRFGPLNSSQILPRLNYVIDQERVQVDEPAKKALIELARGDMRKVLNLLQSCSMAFDAVDENKVYQCCGQPLKSDIKEVVNWLLSHSFNKTFRKVLALQQEKGLALQDIITRLHLYVHKSGFHQLALPVVRQFRIAFVSHWIQKLIPCFLPQSVLPSRLPT